MSRIASLHSEIINGRYRVQRKLGQGGMGTVFLVEDTFDADQLVALKTIRRDVMTPKSLELFKQEFQAMTQFRHPNLVEVLEFGVIADSGHDAGEHFFTMEYVEGKTLLGALRGAALDQICDVTIQICLGLEYIHAQGFTHFDLKPDNIMLNSDAQVKVMDFGLVERGTFFRVPFLKGTVDYIAPEVINGDWMDHRLDLYSLGAVLFHALTGSVLFPGNSMTTILQRHLSEIPDLASQVGSRVPEPLRPVLERLLAKSPRDRYERARDVIPDLRAATGSRKFRSMPALARQGIGSRFVGRQTELTVLKEKFAQRVIVPDPSQPALACITGESGMGKSRLTQELRHHVQVSGVRFLQGSCLQNGGQPFLPFVEILRRLVREILGQITPSPISIGHPEHLHQDSLGGSASGNTYTSNSLLHLAQTMERAPLRPLHARSDMTTQPTLVEGVSGPTPPHSTPTAPGEFAPEARYERPSEWLAYLCKAAPAVARLLPDEEALHALAPNPPSFTKPESERAWLIETLSELFLDLASLQPLVIYCCDLHWADDLTIELLAQLARTARRSAAGPDTPRLLCIGCYRDNEVEGTPLSRTVGHLSAEGHVSFVPLPRLTRSEIHEMMQSILGLIEIDTEALEIIERRTHGNVFAVETMILHDIRRRRDAADGAFMLTGASLREDSASTDVTQVLEQAITELDPIEQDLLRMLAVFNRPVNTNLLSRASARTKIQVMSSAARLMKQRLVVRVFAEGDYLYSLRHARIRDHIYQTLQPEVRRPLHKAVARALADGARPRERYLHDLAMHFQAGGDAEQAIRYGKLAAQQAACLHDYKRAATLYQTTIDLIAELADTPQRRIEQAELAVALATVSYYTPSVHNAQLLERARATAQELGEGALETRVLNWLGRTYYALGRQNDAVRCFKEFMLRSEAAADDAARALPYSVLGRSLIFMGQFTQARDYLERAIHLLQTRIEMPEELSYALGMLGANYAYLGDRTHSFLLMSESIRIAEQINHSLRLVQGKIYKGICASLLGECELAQSLLAPSIEECLRLGNVIGAGTGSSFLGLSYLVQGNLDEALRRIRFGREHIQKAGGTWTFSMIGSHLGEALLQSGDLAAAAQIAEETLAVVTAGERWGEVRLYTVLARLHAQRGDGAGARLWFERAITAGESQQSPMFTAQARLEYAEFLFSHEDRPGAERELAAARPIFTSMQMPIALARVQVLTDRAAL